MKNKRRRTIYRTQSIFDTSIQSRINIIQKFSKNMRATELAPPYIGSSGHARILYYRATLERPMLTAWDLIANYPIGRAKPVK